MSEASNAQMMELFRRVTEAEERCVFLEQRAKRLEDEITNLKANGCSLFSTFADVAVQSLHLPSTQTRHLHVLLFFSLLFTKVFHRNCDRETALSDLAFKESS